MTPFDAKARARKKANLKYRLTHKKELAIKQLEWRKNHPGCHKRWNNKRKEKRRLYRQRVRNRDRKKNLARWKVTHEIRKGLLRRAPCFCGSLKSQAHHDDYSKPLDILWLCQKHHALLHRRMALAAKGESEKGDGG